MLRQMSTCSHGTDALVKKASNVLGHGGNSPERWRLYGRIKWKGTVTEMKDVFEASADSAELRGK